MSINATLLVEVIIFLVFVSLTMKFVWPPIHHVLEERRRMIQDGLDKAEQSRIKLAQASKESQKIVEKAKIEAREMIAHTEERVRQTLDHANEIAEQQRQRIVERAQGDIEQQKQQTHEKLLAEVANLTVKATKAILCDGVDVKVDKKLVNKIVEESRSE